MWAPLPADPPAPGWWTELEFDRWVAGRAAEVRDARRAAEQAKRLRQLRRQAERAAESIVIAMGQIEARQHRRDRRVFPDDEQQFVRDGGRDLPVEHSAPIGWVLGVR